MINAETDKEKNQDILNILIRDAYGLFHTDSHKNKYLSLESDVKQRIIIGAILEEVIVSYTMSPAHHAPAELAFQMVKDGSFESYCSQMIKVKFGEKPW